MKGILIAIAAGALAGVAAAFVLAAILPALIAYP